MTDATTRPPAEQSSRFLDAASIEHSLHAAGWHVQATCLRQCGSTNAEVLTQQPPPYLPNAVLISADEQTAGRGRLDRRWVMDAGAGLLFSVGVRKPVAVDANVIGLLPLATAVAIASVLHSYQAEIAIKWPNDVMVNTSPPGKLAGILLEASGSAIAIGVGLNLTQQPQPEAPSAYPLAALVTDLPDPNALLAQLVDAILRHWSQLYQGNVEELLALYRGHCATIGAQVRVELPDGAVIRGLATDISDQGHLLVQTPTALLELSAGDVYHVRPVEI